MMEGYIMAIDSDRAELVPCRLYHGGSKECFPIDREVAFKMVTSKGDEALNYSGLWWMTRKRHGQRSGWEELGLKPGPSYWCMMQ